VWKIRRFIPDRNPIYSLVIMSLLANIAFHYTFRQVAAERFALADFGRAWKMLESRKNLKPEKCFSKPQTPKNPLHALLGVLCCARFSAFNVRRIRY